MFAVIKTGGKQYIVSPGDKIKVEKLETPEEQEVIFRSVLLVADKETFIGTPYLAGYVVTGKVLGHGKGKKIIVYKYKSKKRYHKKQGHRQLYSEVEILSISGGGQEKGSARKSPREGQIPTKKVEARPRRSQAKRTPTAAKKKVPSAVKDSAVKKKVLSKSKKNN